MSIVYHSRMIRRGAKPPPFHEIMEKVSENNLEGRSMNDFVSTIFPDSNDGTWIDKERGDQGGFRRLGANSGMRCGVMNGRGTRIENHPLGKPTSDKSSTRSSGQKGLSGVNKRLHSLERDQWAFKPLATNGPATVRMRPVMSVVFHHFCLFV